MCGVYIYKNNVLLNNYSDCVVGDTTTYPIIFSPSSVIIEDIINVVVKSYYSDIKATLYIERDVMILFTFNITKSFTMGSNVCHIYLTTLNGSPILCYYFGKTFTVE